MLLVFVTGCGPRFDLSENRGKPDQIVVSAYTQNGCLEQLQMEAKNHGVEVKLTNVETEWRRPPGRWDLLWVPIFKCYKCTGDVTGPSAPIKHGG